MRSWIPMVLLTALMSTGLAGEAPIIEHAGHNWRTPADFQAPDRLPVTEADTDELPPALVKLLKKRWLGAVIQPAEGGVQVQFVLPGLPAELAGLKEGDLIVAVNDVPISNPEHFEQLLARHEHRRPLVTVDRQGERLTLRLLPFTLEPTTFSDGYRLGIILVEFAERPRNEAFTVEEFEALLLSEGGYQTTATGQEAFGSMFDYFHEVSEGQFKLEGRVFDWVTIDTALEDAEDSDMSDAILQETWLQEAMGKVEEREGKGALQEFDGLAFVYAGGRGPHGSLLWPHCSALRYDGQLYSYYVNAGGQERVGPLGTHCHEFGHMVGLPDRYGMGKALGPDRYCLMATGNYGFAPSREDRPTWLCIWCRMQLGWVKPAVLDPKADLDLQVAVPANQHSAFIIPIRDDFAEYYLVENRAGKGFDADFPQPGLLIWHVGEPLRRLRNLVSGPSIDLEEAHGDSGFNAARAHRGRVAFPTEGSNAFGPETLPSSRSLHPLAWGVELNDIQRGPDGAILFRVKSLPPRPMERAEDVMEWLGDVKEALEETPLLDEERRKMFFEELFD